MRSIKFPEMFNSNTTNVISGDKYIESTMQNTKLLLNCERGELFGDPYFGILLKHYLFDQNNYILKDILIDVIYTQIALFIPQLKINRSDIDVFEDEKGTKGKLYCKFHATNQIDYTTNLYTLLLFDNNTIE